MLELLSVVLTGVLSSVCTIAVLKTEIRWIIGTLKIHHERITNIEREYHHENKRSS